MSRPVVTFGLLPLTELEIQLAEQYFAGYHRIPELCACIALALYAVLYIFGTRRNVSIAQQIQRTLQPLLQLQFSVVDSVRKLNHNEYLLYASGRQNVHSMLCTVQLKSRYDLVSQLVQLIIGGGQADTVSVEIPLDTDIVDKYVLCVVKKKLSKQVKKQQYDLHHLGTTQLSDLPSLHTGYTVWCDSSDSAKQVLDADTMALFDRYHAYIDYLHVSDVCECEHDGSTKNTIRLRMQLPASYDELLVVFRQLLRVVDRLPHIRLPPLQRSKNIEQRDIYARLLAKQQAQRAKQDDSSAGGSEDKQKRTEPRRTSRKTRLVR